MNASELLTAMGKDITSLTFGEKMMGAFMVTVLSMMIVFIILIILMAMIKALQIISINKEKSISDSFEPVTSSAEITPKEADEDQGELIAVISAAVAASLGSSISDIRVINVVRTEQDSPIWAKNGRLSQINGRL